MNRSYIRKQVLGAFNCMPNFGVFKNLIFSRKNIALLFTNSSPLRLYQVLKVYLKKVYSKHYFKMRKILTGAKLLLMSI